MLTSNLTNYNKKENTTNKESILALLNIDSEEFNAIPTRELKEQYLIFKLVLTELITLAKSSLDDPKTPPQLIKLNELFEKEKEAILANHKDIYHSATRSLQQFDLPQMILNDQDFQTLLESCKEHLIKVNPILAEKFKLPLCCIPVEKKDDGVEPGCLGHDLFSLILQIYKTGEKENQTRWEFISDRQSNLARIHQAFAIKTNKVMIKLDYETKIHGHVVAPKESLRHSKRMKNLNEKNYLLGEAGATIYQAGKAVKETSVEKNISATQEALASDIARAFGMKTHDQTLHLDYYPDGDMKLMLKATMVKGAKSLQPIEGQPGQSYRVSAGKTSYARLRSVPDFVSDNRLPHFPQYLLILAVLGDPDAIGSLGQNKLIVDNDLFGIDFGKAFTAEFELYYNFHLKNAYKNFSIFYDYPRSDFVRGLICLAKVAGIEIDPIVLNSYGEDFVKKINSLQENADINIFNDYINKFTQLQDKFNKGKKYNNAAECEQIIKRLKQTKKIYVERRDKLIKQFEHYLKIEKHVIDICENIEKTLTHPRKTTDRKNNHAKNIVLNRLQVDPKQLITSKIERDSNDNYTLTVQFENEKKRDEAHVVWLNRYKNLRGDDKKKPKSFFKTANTLEINLQRKELPYLISFFNDNYLQLRHYNEKKINFEKRKRKFLEIINLILVRCNNQIASDFSIFKCTSEFPLYDISKICLGEKFIDKVVKLDETNITELELRLKAAHITLEKKLPMTYETLHKIHQNSLQQDYQSLIELCIHARQNLGWMWDEDRKRNEKAIRNLSVIKQKYIADLNNFNFKDGIQEIAKILEQLPKLHSSNISALIENCNCTLEILSEYKKLVADSKYDLALLAPAPEKNPNSQIFSKNNQNESTVHEDTLKSQQSLPTLSEEIFVLTGTESGHLPSSEDDNSVGKGQQIKTEQTLDPMECFGILEIDPKEFYKLPTKEQKIEYIKFKLILLEIDYVHQLQTKEPSVSGNKENISATENLLKKINNACENLLASSVFEDEENYQTHINQESVALHDQILHQLVKKDLQHWPQLMEEKNIQLKENNISLIKLSEDKTNCFETVHEMKDLFLQLFSSFPNSGDRQQFLKEKHSELSAIYLHFKATLPVIQLQHLDLQSFSRSTTLKEKNRFGIFNKLIPKGNDDVNNQNVALRTTANTLAKAYGLPIITEALHVDKGPDFLRLTIKHQHHLVRDYTSIQSGFPSEKIILTQDNIHYHSQANKHYFAKYFIPLLVLGDCDVLQSLAKHFVISETFAKDFTNHPVLPLNQAFTLLTITSQFYLSAATETFVMNDSVRSEFVRGLILLAKMAGNQIDMNVLDSYGNEFKQEVEEIIPHSDTTIFKDIINYYITMRDQFSAKKHKSLHDSIQKIIDALLEANNTVTQTKEMLLSQFRHLLSVKKEVIDLCENIEKVMMAGSHKTFITVNNVLLNHLQIKDGPKSHIQHINNQYQLTLTFNHKVNPLDRDNAYKALVKWKATRTTETLDKVEINKEDNTVTITFAETKIAALSTIFNEDEIIEVHHSKEHQILKQSRFEQEIMRTLNKIQARLTKQKRGNGYLIKLKEKNTELSEFILALFKDSAYATNINPKQYIAVKIDHLEEACQILKQNEEKLNEFTIQASNLSSHHNLDDNTGDIFDNSVQFFNVSDTSYEQLLTATIQNDTNALDAIDKLLRKPPTTSSLKSTVFLKELRGQKKFFTIINHIQQLLPIEAEHYAPLLALQMFYQHRHMRDITQPLIKMIQHFKIENDKNFIIANTEIINKILEHMLCHLFNTLDTFNREQLLAESALDLSVGFKYLADPGCRIEQLNLSGKLSRNECEELSAALKKNNTIRELDLSNSQLTKHITAIVDSLKGNTHLTVLKLVNCELTDDSLLEIINLLKVNFTIKEIDLSQNPNITSKYFEKLISVLDSRGKEYVRPIFHLDRNISINIYWRTKINELSQDPKNSDSLAIVEKLSDSEVALALPKETMIKRWEASHSKESCELISHEIISLTDEKEQLIHMQQANLRLTNMDPMAFQNQIDLLDARLRLLEQEHRVKIEKQGTIADLKGNQQPCALEFFNFLVINLENLFLASKAISCGLLHSVESSTQTKINQAAETGMNIGGGLVSMVPVIGPLISTVIKAAGGTGLEVSKVIDQVRRDESVKRIGNIIPLCDIEKTAYDIATAVTYSYLEQLNHLHTKEKVIEDRDSKKAKFKDKAIAWTSKNFEKTKETVINQEMYSDAERLALLVVTRIWTSLQSDVINKSDSLALQLIAEVAKEPSTTEKAFHELYTALGSEKIDYLDWVYKDILLLPGVKVKSKNGYLHYSSENLNPEKYSFRESTNDEVKRLGLTACENKQSNQNSNQNVNQTQAIIPKPTSSSAVSLKSVELQKFQAQLTGIYVAIEHIRKTSGEASQHIDQLENKVSILEEQFSTLLMGYSALNEEHETLIASHSLMAQQLNQIMNHLGLSIESPLSSTHELPKLEHSTLKPSWPTSESYTGQLRLFSKTDGDSEKEDDNNNNCQPKIE